jgi:catechol 2,3-dioxygenase-like lactoylglutathione lyase family enzyme
MRFVTRYDGWRGAESSRRRARRDGRSLAAEVVRMLLDGFNHVAVLTNDSDRLQDFYREVFDAKVTRDGAEPGAPAGVRLTIIQISPHAELNVFEIDGNTEADRQVPMFGRGRLDHMALQAESIEAFETIRQRLIDRGAADEFVTDFGPILSLFFRDPDGLECEVCVPNPDAVPGAFHPPGTPAARYQS